MCAGLQLQPLIRCTLCCFAEVHREAPRGASVRGPLEYAALAIIVIVGLTIVYGMVALCSVPHRMAQKRNHPHQDAIQIAGWFSLFLFHALEPFLWIWATMYDPKRGWGFSAKAAPDEATAVELSELRARISQLESRQSRSGE